MASSRFRTIQLATVFALVAAATIASGGPAGASGEDPPAAPGAKYNEAFFPTQSSGNRGADVLAIQYLLQHHGHAAPADGVFAASTLTAVKAFQTAAGLAADGIVGPLTWGALVTTLRTGATGAAVKALQTQLNAKRRLTLPVDGTFSAAVNDAVRAFQSHASIGVDGIVGPTTWRNLAWHYVYPKFTHMCDQDPDGNGTANWGTAAAVGQLEAAVAAFAATGRGKVPLGDIGFEHGGAIPGHASHQVGLDVDIWPIRTDSAQCTAGRITWRSPEYDRDATRELVKAVRAAAPGHIVFVLFNDPTLIAEGLTTQYDNHDNHLHVRYCEKGHPSSSYRC